MSDKLICGIDIGSYKIATIVGIESKEDGEPRIIGFNTTPSRGVKKGLIVDIDQVTGVVEESVEKAERMAGHKIKGAFVSIGGPHIASLNSHGVVAVSNPSAEIGEADVERVVEAARAISLSTTKQIIEVTPREYIVDGQSGIKNPIGMSGVRLEVDTHIITASLTSLKNIDRCLGDLGIDNHGFIFSGLSASEAVLTDTEKELGVLLMDIGGGKIDLALYSEGALSYSGSIPVGARHITNDIAVGLRVSLESAEKIKLYLAREAKRTHEATRADKLDLSHIGIEEKLPQISLKNLISGIMQPRMEEIFKLVAAEVDKSDYKQHIPSGVVVTGGGALTVEMVEVGKRIMRLPVRVGVPRGVAGLLDEVLDPQYAATVGLILYGRKNIIAPTEGFKNFNRVLKDFSLGKSVGKVKQFIKQFIP